DVVASAGCRRILEVPPVGAVVVVGVVAVTVLGDDLKDEEILSTVLAVPGLEPATFGDGLILVSGRQVVLVLRIELHLDVGVPVGLHVGLHDFAADGAAVVLGGSAVAVMESSWEVHAHHCGRSARPDRIGRWRGGRRRRGPLTLLAATSTGGEHAHSAERRYG